MVLVARVLQQRYLAKFLNSNLYRKYLSELFSQIQTGPYKSGAGGGSGRKVSRRGFGLRRSGSNTSLSTCSSSEVSRSLCGIGKLFTCGFGEANRSSRGRLIFFLLMFPPSNEWGPKELKETWLHIRLQI